MQPPRLATLRREFKSRPRIGPFLRTGISPIECPKESPQRLDGSAGLSLFWFLFRLRLALTESPTW